MALFTIATFVCSIVTGGLRAYKEWLCAALIPYYVNGFRVQPCSTYCRQVEMMCPFFRPKTETHFGDPSFICKDPGMKNGLTEDDGDYIKPCFQMCHVVSADDIRNAFCHPDNVTCPGLDHELKECPKLLDYFLDAQNSTGLLGNATSSVAGSVIQGHVSRTASVIAQLLWVGVVLIGAEQHCLVVQAVMTILLLSVILTACPYTSIGLT